MLSDILTTPLEGSDPNKEYYYRYEGHYSANGGYDITGEWVPSHSGTYSIKADKYEVLKHTPKGVWLNVYGYTDKPNSRNAKFVNASHNKRFALPTEEEALVSFIARKDREAAIHYGRGLEAERYKRLALQITAERHIPVHTSTFLFEETEISLDRLVMPKK